MTHTLNALPAAADTDVASPGLRKTSNLLALCVAAYREGDIDTAFDLFLSGMQCHLNDVESANVGVDPRSFGQIIESALNRAAVAMNEDETEASVVDDVFDLANLTDEDFEIDDVLTGEVDEDGDESIDDRLDAMAALSAF